MHNSDISCSCARPAEPGNSRRAFLRTGVQAAAGAALLPALPFLEPSAHALPTSNLRVSAGIVTNDERSSDPAKEADVIMTAVTIGLAADHIASRSGGIRFDTEASDADLPTLRGIASRMDRVVGRYLERQGRIVPGQVTAGTTMKFEAGTVIMGVYKLIGQNAPSSMPMPTLSTGGEELWQRIVAGKVQNLYVGRGAYTGFVDVKGPLNKTKPIGPLSTVRLTVLTAADTASAPPFPRWLPSAGSPLWKARTTPKGMTMPWGMILPKNMNDAVGVTAAMQQQGMKYFPSAIGKNDIATYTHGMIQAIYKAYQFGPDCEPYEIPVGNETTKLASCLTCTLFMYACGYPPTSIHLGRGESWAPLYRPYDPDGFPAVQGEAATIRSLNARWYKKCDDWLRIGLVALDDAFLDPAHLPARNAVRNFVQSNKNPTVAGTLVLDAVTVHDKELSRIDRTLKKG